jgi:hypothetical protein
MATPDRREADELVWRVYADGRPDELVGGIDIVGTPLSAMNRILAPHCHGHTLVVHRIAQKVWGRVEFPKARLSALQLFLHGREQHIRLLGWRARSPARNSRKQCKCGK